jgi:acyl-CoA thioester hydrolase
MAYAFPIRVYWEDTDAGGIVFYANYLKFFERARTEWLRSLGVEQRQLKESSGGMFVVSETQLKYHRPARLDDQLLVTAALHAVGGASMTIRQQALLKSEHSRDATNATDVLLCEGDIRIGWVDAVTLRPARIPATILERLDHR